jgi:transposase
VSISLELTAEILRLHHAERWPVGTIARQLHVRRDTVQRVLGSEGLTPHALAPRPSRLDPYRAFIAETLAKYPTLSASRLYVMVSERGYVGGAHHFRHLVAALRPRPAAQAYLRLRTLPGEQAQVDWAHFGYVQIGRARRPLMAFVMVLSYSRRIFLRFFLDARMDSFLRGHVEAFTAWSGSPRILLYDFVAGHKMKRVFCLAAAADEFRSREAAAPRTVGKRSRWTEPLLGWRRAMGIESTGCHPASSIDGTRGPAASC